VPDPVEFHLDMRVMPATPEPQRQAILQFFVHDPWKNRPVTTYNVVHEKFFHAFVVSEDLQFFEHGHPRLAADGLFQYPITFPKTGMYRVLSDLYPVGATPQLTTETIFVPGAPPDPVRLGRPEVEFEVAFPRPQTYRVWVQFQRDGVVNTVHFDIPVVSLE
jgi:hypothetical protein